MNRLFDYIAAVGVGMCLTNFLVSAALGLWWTAVLNLALALFNFHFSYTAIMGEVNNEPS